jgi:DNA polymerase-3 subunit beta
LNIESASSNTKIKGISPDEFPLIPQVETEQELELSVKDLLNSINATCFAAAVNTSRPALSGVLFNVQESEFLLVGTDSFRLAEFRIALPAAPAFQGQYIVPARTVSELAKIMEKANDSSIKIKFSDNQILFEIGNALVISRLIDGKFPEYSQIIPKERKTRVECEVGSLSLAMRRASLFSRENNHSMRFEIKSDGKMLLHTDETRVGEENAEIEVAFEGEENMISLNAQYVLDVLNIFGEKKLTIDLIDKDAPALIRESGNQSYIYLIMPLKTNS